MTRWLRKILGWVFTPIIALLLIFEEWGWEPLSRLLKYLVGLPFWASMWVKIGKGIASLPPWAALFILAAPTALLFPIKLGALYLIGRGQHVAGVSLLVVAKIIGTAILAHLFDLTRPALMQLTWFAKWYPRWKVWKDGIMQRVRSSRVWTASRKLKALLSHNFRLIKDVITRKVP